jgi:hypothetical protein
MSGFVSLRSIIDDIAAHGSENDGHSLMLGKFRPTRSAHIRETVREIVLMTCRTCE